ncbi:MAG: TolC family protein [bacterium]
MLRRGLLYIMWICCIVFSRPSQCQKLTLDGAIGEALIKNPELLKACQELKAVNADVWEGISPEYPELFVEWEGIPEGVRSLSGFEEKKTGIAQGFEFPLAYVFKGVSFRQRQKRAAAEYLMLKNRVVSEVKKRFYRVLLLEQQVLLYESIVQVTKDVFQKARVRVLAGDSSPYDTLKVRVDLTEVENRLFTLQKGEEVSRTELKQILGRSMENPLDVEGVLEYKAISLRLDSLFQTALFWHPMMGMVNAQIGQMRAERNLAWTEILPQFHVRYFRQEFNGVNPAKGWGGEVGLSVPLWFFLRGQGRIRSASHRARAAEFEAESVRRSVRLGVDRAFAQLQVAEKHVQNYEENTLRQVDELVRIATRSYEEGEMGYLELAEALRTMNRVNVDYFDSLFQVLAAQADIELAVGTVLGR